MRVIRGTRTGPDPDERLPRRCEQLRMSLAEAAKFDFNLDQALVELSSRSRAKAGVRLAYQLDGNRKPRSRGDHAESRECR